MQRLDVTVGVAGSVGIETAVLGTAGRSTPGGTGAAPTGLGTVVPYDTDLPCRAEPDLFFADDPAEVERAKGVCRTCRVRATCLAGALQRAEPWGVWGGELFLRGTVVPRKRPRGRPRKNEVAA